MATFFLLRLQGLGLGKSLGPIPPEVVGHDPETKALLGKQSGSPNIAPLGEAARPPHDEAEANDVLGKLTAIPAKEKPLIAPEELRSMLEDVRGRLG